MLLKLGVTFAVAFILMWVFASVSIARSSDFGPRPGGNGGRHSVAEPAAIALLGAGLVSLGLYAKRKIKK